MTSAEPLRLTHRAHGVPSNPRLRTTDIEGASESMVILWLIYISYLSIYTHTHIAYIHSYRGRVIESMVIIRSTSICTQERTHGETAEECGARGVFMKLHQHSFTRMSSQFHLLHHLIHSQSTKFSRILIRSGIWIVIVIASVEWWVCVFVHYVRIEAVSNTLPRFLRDRGSVSFYFFMISFTSSYVSMITSCSAGEKYAACPAVAMVNSVNLWSIAGSI